ncbi:Pyridoxal-dependent decarboxylase family protein isoform 1 [Hibiscus syriacus]|uniref:Pyridoxal-dependent decarboxylase family protein isoform 1 n=1 Tax=Hibiscus syriacus TaxID=106335 RepID=A0A6A2Z5S0_HIBSY|nr:Pyridoxal-dependent decarboxylase family protein isoform 1 [Hibiscus syriacus]
MADVSSLTADRHGRTCVEKSDVESSEDEKKARLGGIKKEAISYSTKFRHSLQKIRRRSRVMSSDCIEDDLDAKELQSVAAFRQALVADDLLPAKHDDHHMILRFLKARKFDQDKAKEMWADMLQWRKDFGTDSIVEDFDFKKYDDVIKYYPQGYHGKDFEKILNVKLSAASIAAKRHITQKHYYIGCRRSVTSYASFQRLKSFNKAARELLQRLQKIDGNNYPKDLSCYGAQLNRSLTQRPRRKSIELPELFGGTCNCADKGGCMVSDKGPWKDPEILKRVENGEAKSTWRTLSGINEKACRELHSSDKKIAMDSAEWPAENLEISIKKMCQESYAYGQLIPIVDKGVDSSWPKSVEDKKFAVPKGTTKGLQMLRFEVRTCLMPPLKALDSYQVKNVGKSSEGMGSGIFGGIMAFAMGFVTMFHMSHGMLKKQSEAPVYGGGQVYYAKPITGPAPPPITNAEFFAMPKRMAALEEKVVLLSTKPAIMPPDKEELLNAALNRICVLEKQLSETRKALQDALGKQRELQKFIDRKEMKKSANRQNFSCFRC